MALCPCDIRLAANIAYEDAQAQYQKMETPFAKEILKPLWDCWKLLAKARDKREPLNLDLPERRIVLDDKGQITSIAVRERLDAHRLVEDFMIAANVAAAKALEGKKQPVVYRVHETPSREKLVAMKDYLATFDMNFALGQVIKPATFNRILSKVTDKAVKPLVMEQILRSQTQAYYSPRNQGHFGLALASYGHFTSPIRRYADLLLHRALVDGFKLEQPAPKGEKSRQIPSLTGLDGADKANLSPICERISGYERRAMEAERDTTDRYVASFLAKHIGEVFETRITGVQNFGFFATILDFGGDGLVPISTLGSEYFTYDEASQTLRGETTGTEFTSGQRLKLKLAEADPITGALKFALVDLPDYGAMDDQRKTRKRGARPAGKTAGKYRQGKRGRPGNIRHKGRKK